MSTRSPRRGPSRRCCPPPSSPPGPSTPMPDGCSTRAPWWRSRRTATPARASPRACPSSSRLAVRELRLTTEEAVHAATAGGASVASAGRPRDAVPGPEGRPRRARRAGPRLPRLPPRSRPRPHRGAGRQRRGGPGRRRACRGAEAPRLSARHDPTEPTGPTGPTKPTKPPGANRTDRAERAARTDRTDRTERVPQWPRAIHSSRWGDSSPIVVSSPWPVSTRVAPGRTSRRVRIDSMIVGKSEKLRPVAPGPPRKACRRRRPRPTRRRGGSSPPACGPACGPPRARRRRPAATGRRRACRRAPGRDRPHPTARGRPDGAGSARPSPGRAPSAALMWSLWPWVATIATTRRPATASRIGAVVVRGVDDEDLGAVADEPDVVLDLEVLAVESEGPARPDAVDHEATTTTERSTSPRSIRWKASSTPSSGIVSVTKRSRSSRPWR